MTEILPGKKYEVIVQVISQDNDSILYQEIPADDSFSTCEKQIKKELFNKRFVRQGSVYLGYYKIDGIKDQVVHVTPINLGNVPVDTECELPLEDCQGIFHPLHQTPSPL